MRALAEGGGPLVIGAVSGWGIIHSEQSAGMLQSTRCRLRVHLAAVQDESGRAHTAAC